MPMNVPMPGYAYQGRDGRWYSSAEWGPYQATLREIDQRTADTQALESDYGTAKSALEGSKTADVGEYERTSPFAKKAALARLTSRGLGRSIMGNIGTGEGSDDVSQIPRQVGGYGSGSLRETDIGITKGLESIMSDYQNLGQGLERQKLSESINLDDFYRNLAMARSNANSKKAGLTDILGLAPAVGSLFI